MHNQVSFSGLSCPLEPFAKGRESPVPKGRRGEEGGALGRARREGLQDAGPMRGLPEGAKRVRICRSIRRLARHDAGQGIHPARSNPPPVQGLGSLRLRRVKSENDWRTDSGFPTTAQGKRGLAPCYCPFGAIPLSFGRHGVYQRAGSPTKALAARREDKDEAGERLAGITGDGSLQAPKVNRGAGQHSGLVAQASRLRNWKDISRKNPLDDDTTIRQGLKSHERQKIRD